MRLLPLILSTLAVALAVSAQRFKYQVGGPTRSSHGYDSWDSVDEPYGRGEEPPNCMYWTIMRMPRPEDLGGICKDFPHRFLRYLVIYCKGKHADWPHELMSIACKNLGFTLPPLPKREDVEPPAWEHVYGPGGRTHARWD